MDESQQASCKYCYASISGYFYFCPNCGRMLREKTTISRQIVVYFVSLFAPPFGLIYAWRFLRQEGSKSKIIGVVALVLTMISIAAVFWIFAGLIKSVNEQINALNSGSLYIF